MRRREDDYDAIDVMSMGSPEPSGPPCTASCVKGCVCVCVHSKAKTALGPQLHFLLLLLFDLPMPKHSSSKIPPQGTTPQREIFSAQENFLKKCPPLTILEL